MDRDTVETGPYWKLPLLVVAASVVVFLLLIAYTAYFFVWIPFVAIIVCLFCFMLVAIAAIRKRKRQIISLLIAIIVLVAVAAGLFKGGCASQLPSLVAVVAEFQRRASRATISKWRAEAFGVGRYGIRWRSE